MKRFISTFPYLFRTFRFDQLWLSAALWGVFIFISVLLRNQAASVEARMIYLVIVLPLVTGIMAAYALLGDPVLELHFSTPVGAFWMLFERLSLVMGLTFCTALAYQIVLAGLGLDLSFLGTLIYRQAVWFVPSMTLMGIGTAAGFAMKQSTGGALFSGVLIVLEAIMHTVFSENPWARLFYLFIGFDDADPYSVLQTQIFLCILSTALLAASVAMLKRQERYI